jgi:hypothetical protein
MTNRGHLQWVSALISPEIKLVGREADHWPPSSVEIKNESIIILPLHIYPLIFSFRMEGFELNYGKHSKNLMHLI